MRHKLIVCYFLARNILLMPCHFWHQNYDVQIFCYFSLRVTPNYNVQYCFDVSGNILAQYFFSLSKNGCIYGSYFLREKSSPTLMLYFKHNFKKPQQYFISVMWYRYMNNDLQPFFETTNCYSLFYHSKFNKVLICIK